MTYVTYEAPCLSLLEYEDLCRFWHIRIQILADLGGNIMTYPAPRLIFWETTAGCNLRCIHCRRVTVADQLTPQDLKTGEARALVDQIAAVGKPVFVLSGGEPLFRPDIFEIARYAT